MHQHEETATTATNGEPRVRGRFTSFTNGEFVFPVADNGPLDGPPVLLLHGWPQDGHVWADVSQLLNARGFRTFAPHLRGACATANPAKRRSYRSDELLTDVAAMVEQIGQPVHIVGHDWGAALGWTTAARRPDLLRTLTAVSVPHPAAFRATAARRPMQAIRAIHMALFQIPILPELLFANKFIASRVLMAYRQPKDVATIATRRMATYALRRGGFNWYRGALITPLTQLGSSTEVPILQIWSDRDGVVGRESIERSATYAHGRYRIAVFKGISHWIPETAPGLLAEQFIEHVKENADTNAGN